VGRRVGCQVGCRAGCAADSRAQQSECPSECPAMNQCDLFVIGGGSGGVRAARVAALNGAKVAIAEESRWGGTCVIRGCVQKKLLVSASRYRDDFEDAPG